jgi:RNA ligase (TIGR02306 family)
MERKLASVRIVNEIIPIDGADSIELAKIDGWQVVVKKGEFQVGDMCAYFEIDSFLPEKPEFEFLRKSSFKAIQDGCISRGGFRLKTIKLRGQLSQGLALPIDTFKDTAYWTEGLDITEELQVTKWEPIIPAQLAGKMKGNFPSLLKKTDEERIQNLSSVYENFKRNKSFYATEKLDGSSATFYLNNGLFGVCSRNIDLLETDGNAFWQAARKLDIENKLRTCGTDNIAIQGELVGPGIQGNPYKLDETMVFFFNAFDIDKQKYLDYEDFAFIVGYLMNLLIVPILDDGYELPETIEELLLEAEGKSELCDATEREGLVIRSFDRNISFKVISNKFLLSKKE